MQESIFIFTNVISIANFLYLFQTIFVNYVPSGSWIAAFYSYFCTGYSLFVVAWFSILTELWISIERYLIIAKMRHSTSKKAAWAIAAAIFVFTALIDSPLLFSSYIASSGTNSYNSRSTFFGQSEASKWVLQHKLTYKGRQRTDTQCRRRHI